MTPPPADRILIVDDDREIRQLLTEYLASHGYRVSVAGNGAEMRKVLADTRVDLVVLDLMLPGEDGLSLCRDLRARDAAHVPVLMLTARREEADRIVGLEMGADDYLAKPFAARELLARIRAVLRRTQMLPPNLRAAEPSPFIAFDGWRLDTRARHLEDPDGTMVALTGGEYRMLRVLLDHPQRVLTRDQLLNLTQGRDADPFDRSIDIQISRLRQKLGEDARLPQIIKTVRNGGYVLAGQVTVEPHA